MYCAFCGRELPDGEGCTCCRAVSARNDNPNYRDRKTFFQVGTPLDFDHGHESYSYKTDSHGKLDSCQYGGQDEHTRPGTYVTSASHTSPASTERMASLTQRSNSNDALKKGGWLLWIIYAAIFAIVALSMIFE